MSRQDDLKKLITTRQRYLQKLKEKRALKGANAEPDLLIELEDVEHELEALQAELAALKSEPESNLPPRSVDFSPKSSSDPNRRLRLIFGAVVTLGVLFIVGLSAGIIYFINRKHETSAGALFASIIDIKPEVEVKRNGTDRLEPARFGMTVAEGDIINTYTNASASLICENGNAYKLAAQSNLELDCDDTTSDRFAGHVDVVLSGQLVNQPQATLPLAVASEVVRSSRAEQAEIPLLLTPRNTSTIETQPTFRWQPVPGATGYRLSLNLASGESWSRETTDTSLAYPSDAPALAPGSANVVNLATLDNETAVDKTLLQVVAEPELKSLTEAEKAIQALNLAEAAERYLLAQLYRRYELRSAAIDQLQHLIEAEPAPSASLHQQLGDLHLEVGLYLQAEADYQAALAAAEQAGDLASQAAAHIGLARTAELFEESEAVLDHLNTAEVLYRQAGQTEQAESVAAEKAELEK
jgi:hypothetical protein